MSLSEKGEFAPVLEKMLQEAAGYFGHESNGLQYSELPKAGNVELGPLKSLGPVETK